WGETNASATSFAGHSAREPSRLRRAQQASCRACRLQQANRRARGGPSRKAEDRNAQGRRDPGRAADRRSALLGSHQATREPADEIAGRENRPVVPASASMLFAPSLQVLLCLRIAQRSRLLVPLPCDLAVAGHAVAVVIERAQPVHAGVVAERRALFEQPLRPGIVARPAFALHVHQAEIVHRRGDAGLQRGLQQLARLRVILVHAGAMFVEPPRLTIAIGSPASTAFWYQRAAST